LAEITSSGGTDLSDNMYL